MIHSFILLQLGSNSPSNPEIAFYVIILLSVIGLITQLRHLRVRSNWQHTFANVQFAVHSFYDILSASIKERKIPGVSVSKVFHSQGGTFSSKREYLRVTYNDYVFDICAAPFGGGFFVSWWLMERDPNLLARIPVLRTILGIDPNQKSFYRQDTEAMFRGSIQSCVSEAIREITETQGVRTLTEQELQPVQGKGHK